MSKKRVFSLFLMGLALFSLVTLTGCPKPQGSDTTAVVHHVWTDSEGRQSSRQVFDDEEVSVSAEARVAKFNFDKAKFVSGSIEYKKIGQAEPTRIGVRPDSNKAAMQGESVKTAGYPYGFWWNNCWYPNGYWWCTDCPRACWWHGPCPYHGCGHGHAEHADNLWAVFLGLGINNFPEINLPILNFGEFSITVEISDDVEWAELCITTAKGTFNIRINVQGRGFNNPSARGVIRIETYTNTWNGPAVYIDPLSHNDLRELILNLPENWWDQSGGFFWYKDFPEQEGVVSVREFNDAPVIIPLETIFSKGRSLGAEVVRFAHLGYNRDYPNVAIPDYVGDAFTVGYPYWWKDWKWDIYLDGCLVEPTNGYVEIPIPDSGTPPPPPPSDNQFCLEVAISPANAGWVEVDGERLDDGWTIDIEEGATIQVRAFPEEGFEFSHWEGDLSGSTNPKSLLMNQDRFVRAVFIECGTPPPPPPSGDCVAGVEFVHLGSDVKMRIHPDGFTLAQITANESAVNLPRDNHGNVTVGFPDVNGLGVEIVNLPSPFWFLRDVASGTMAANAWSTNVTLDGTGTDSNGNAKTVAVANWCGGRAIPFYTLNGCPGQRFYLNTGTNRGTLDGSPLSVDTTGYIWPSS